MQQQMEQVEAHNVRMEFGKALELLSSWPPDLPKVSVERGKALAGLGRFDEAAAHFARAAALYSAAAAQQQPKREEETVSQLPPPKHEFFQNPSHVFVTLSVKDVSPDSLSVTLLPDRVEVIIQDRFAFRLVPFAEIDREASSCKVTKYKVELSLAKKVAGTQWPQLESGTASVSAVALPSPYTSKKDWKQPVAEEEDEGPEDDPMNAFLRKIYKDADDEQRMAMKKSMQTSGGTVLTTNWGEAKGKDFSKEIKPPKGQEFKTWDGKVVASAEKD